MHIPTPCTSAGVKEHPDRCDDTCHADEMGVCCPSPTTVRGVDCGWGELTQHLVGLTHPFSPFPLLVYSSTDSVKRASIPAGFSHHLSLGSKHLLRLGEDCHPSTPRLGLPFSPSAVVAKEPHDFQRCWMPAMLDVRLLHQQGGKGTLTVCP